MCKRLIAAIGAAIMLSACSTPAPEIQTGDDAEVIMGGLNKVDNSRTDLAYVDPNADFSKYGKVMITPLGVDNVEIIQPDKTRGMYGSKNWELTDSDKVKLQDAYYNAMVKQLQEKGDYPVVTEADDDVLQIVATLTAIAPNAGKDADRMSGRSRSYTEGAGGLAVMVVYGDSETGEVLGIMKDSKSSNAVWGSNNSVSNMADVRRMFDSWAIQIRNGLDRVSGNKE